MYAIFFTGGKQYTAAPGDTLYVEKLGVEDGGCTADGKFSLDACRCLGCCGMAPVMMVNDDVYGNLTGEELDAILAKYQ